jgi:hypothetical protein
MGNGRGEDEMNPLIDIVNSILEEAQAAKQEIDGAINWGDLSCTEAHMSKGVLYCTIEEANPINEELESFISNRLKAKLYDSKITFEW